MENSRRNFIKNTAMASLAVAATPAKSFSILHQDKQPDDQTIGHNGFTYKVDKNWAKVSVTNTPLANCHEMVQDSKGRLIMLGDHTHNNILIFDKSGKLLDYWGTALPGGHGLSISKEGGEDFLLLTDCGWALDRTGNTYGQSGQVLKTTVDGKLIFAIGHPRTIGIYKDTEPFKPTETAVAPNGDIYVADGYGSDYIKRIDMPGMYVCRAVINDSNIYAGVCWSKNAQGKQFDGSGFVTILDKDNKVISNPGGDAPVYKNGILQQTLQAKNATFMHGHDVCIDEDKSIYVCQWNANHTAPVKLTRV
jgi:hypothetical protein